MVLEKKFAKQTKYTRSIHKFPSSAGPYHWADLAKGLFFIINKNKCTFDKLKINKNTVSKLLKTW